MLYYKIKKYLEANSKTVSEFDNNIRLQNDGSGDYIKSWNVSGLAKPTDDQLLGRYLSITIKSSFHRVPSQNRALDAGWILIDPGERLQVTKEVQINFAFGFDYHIMERVENMFSVLHTLTFNTLSHHGR